MPDAAYPDTSLGGTQSRSRPLTIQGAMDDDALKRKKNELAAWISNGTITSATLSQWFPKPLDINAPLSTSTTSTASALALTIHHYA